MMKRCLHRIAERGYRDRLAAACHAHALAQTGGLTLILYDLTTLYFEAEHEDSLRKVGYSKERRVDPQIIVGLLVDRHGFPLEVGSWEGNRAEAITIISTVQQFQRRYAGADVVVVADAGMLSTSNLDCLDAAGLRFIVGSRAVKAPRDLASHFRWHGGLFTDGQLVDTITPRTNTAKARKINNLRVKDEPIWNAEKFPTSWRAVWHYSRKRVVHDEKTLRLQEDKARRVVAGEQTPKTPRFVKIRNGVAELGRAELDRAHALVGLKGYVTNIPANVMPAQEIVDSYHDLWHVEQSFRMSKHDLKARPIFHHHADVIDAHLTIVFAALAVARAVQKRTGLSPRTVIRKLQPLRSATKRVNSTQQTLPAIIPNNAQHIINQLAKPGH